MDVYVGLYIRANPHRAHEIHQHIMNIGIAAASYVWDEGLQL